MDMDINVNYIIAGVAVLVMLALTIFFKIANKKQLINYSDFNEDLHSNITYKDKESVFAGDNHSSEFLSNPYLLDEFYKDEGFSKDLTYIENEEDDEIEIN